MRKQSLLSAGLGAVCLLAAGPASAVSATFGDTEFTLGGYVKLDAAYSRYTEGPAPSDRGRQFHIPALIPTSDGSASSDGATDFSARESRFNIKTRTVKGAHTFESFVEVDFLDPGFDGDLGNQERLVNSSGARLRHAYAAWEDPQGNRWLLGQTWSTFMELGAYPDLLDFIGPSQGMTFVRQSQIRLERGPLQVALENPESTITPNGGGARINDNSDNLPDLVAKYRVPLRGGNLLSFGGLLRQLDGSSPSAQSNKAVAYALNISGKLMLGPNDLRYQVNYGDGIGRYLGLNTANGAVIDNNGELETIEAFGGYLAYRHHWTQRWRSNLVFGYFSADNDTALTGATVTESAQSVHVNLLYSPVSAFTIGAEYIFAERELENGDDGALHRLQFSAKYAF